LYTTKITISNVLFAISKLQQATDGHVIVIPRTQDNQS